MTNMSGKRVFGRVDAVVKRAPNVTVEKVEAQTMFSANKIATGLGEKTPEQQKTARKEGSGIEAIERQAKRQIASTLQEKLLCKRAELEAKEQQKKEVTEKLIQDLQSCSLWIVADVETHLAVLSSRTRRNMR